MSKRTISVLTAAGLALGLAGCVPYPGYGPGIYGGPVDGGAYYAAEPPFEGGYYPGPSRYDGYEGARFGADYGRSRGDERALYRQQQGYNQAVLAQQRQQNQVVLQQQQYNNAVVAQQNAYNQALLAQQRAAAQGR